MARICVFDVNETLLDLKALDPHFAQVFGDATARQEWFKQLLHFAFTATIINKYTDFGTLGAAALELVARRRNITLSEEEQSTILSTIKHLPPHPDVKEGLEILKKAGVRLVTLTNSTSKVGQAQINNAGLGEYFEELFSADEAKHLKPAPEPYRMVAERLGVKTTELRLIAAHDWDVAGAMQAGCAAAFVARPGMILSSLFEKPDVIGVDLKEVAEGILKQERL